MTMPLRTALYLRSSTARQAEHDVSIPDQKRRDEAYCEARGPQLVETFIEPGASATASARPHSAPRSISAKSGTWDRSPGCSRRW